MSQIFKLQWSDLTNLFVSADRDWSLVADKADPELVWVRDYDCKNEDDYEDGEWGFSTIPDFCPVPLVKTHKRGKYTWYGWDEEELRELDYNQPNGLRIHCRRTDDGWDVELSGPTDSTSVWRIMLEELARPSH